MAPAQYLLPVSVHILCPGILNGKIHSPIVFFNASFAAEREQCHIWCYYTISSGYGIPPGDAHGSDRCSATHSRVTEPARYHIRRYYTTCPRGLSYILLKS